MSSTITRRSRACRFMGVLTAGLLGAACLLPMSCQSYTPYSAGEHMGNRFDVWARDFISIGKSVDRHFFNYDWDDPKLGR